MYHQPYYANYPPNVSYNPYLHSSYQRSNPFERVPVYDSTIPPRSYYQRPQPQQYYDGISPQEAQIQQERARALAERQARRAQYLPDEEDSVGSDEEWEYNQLGPRERAYVDARRRAEALEHQRIEEEKARAREAELARARAEEEAEMRRVRQQELKKLQEERRRQFQQRQKEQQELQERLYRQRQQERSSSIPINVHNTPSTRTPPPTSRQTPSQSHQPPRPPTPKKFEPTIVYGEDHQDAAAKIQRQYRIHKSFKSLSQYAKQFEELKSNFAYPCNIDFQKPDHEEGVITVRATHPPSNYEQVEKEREEAEKAAMEAGDEDVTMEEEPTFDGKLAYTSTNYNLHQYSDSMDKLLIKLDGVESWGCKAVRERRRAIVKTIGREAARLDWYWKEAWEDYTRKQSAVRQEEKPVQEQQSESATAVDMEPPVQVEMEPPVQDEQEDASAQPVSTEEPMQEVEQSPEAKVEPMQQDEPQTSLPSVPEPQSDGPRRIPITGN